MRYNCRLLFIITLKHEGISFHSKFVLEYFGFGLGRIELRVNENYFDRFKSGFDLASNGIFGFESCTQNSIGDLVKACMASYSCWKYFRLNTYVSFKSKSFEKKCALYTNMVFFLNRPHIFNTYFFSWSRKTSIKWEFKNARKSWNLEQHFRIRYATKYVLSVNFVIFREIRFREKHFIHLYSHNYTVRLRKFIEWQIILTLNKFEIQ